MPKAPVQESAPTEIDRQAALNLESFRRNKRRDVAHALAGSLPLLAGMGAISPRRGHPSGPDPRAIEAERRGLIQRKEGLEAQVNEAAKIEKLQNQAELTQLTDDLFKKEIQVWESTADVFKNNSQLYNRLQLAKIPTITAEYQANIDAANARRAAVERMGESVASNADLREFATTFLGRESLERANELGQDVGPGILSQDNIDDLGVLVSQAQAQHGDRGFIRTLDEMSNISSTASGSHAWTPETLGFGDEYQKAKQRVLDEQLEVDRLDTKTRTDLADAYKQEIESLNPGGTAGQNLRDEYNKNKAEFDLDGERERLETRRVEIETPSETPADSPHAEEIDYLNQILERMDEQPYHPESVRTRSEMERTPAFLKIQQEQGFNANDTWKYIRARHKELGPRSEMKLAGATSGTPGTIKRPTERRRPTEILQGAIAPAQNGVEFSPETGPTAPTPTEVTGIGPSGQQQSLVGALQNARFSIPLTQLAETDPTVQRQLNEIDQLNKARRDAIARQLGTLA